MRRYDAYQHHKILRTSSLFALGLIIFVLLTKGWASAGWSSSTTIEKIPWDISTYSILPNFDNPLTISLPTAFDLMSDDSWQRYISDETPFADAYYVPIDLAPIDSNFTANNAKKFLLRQEAADRFADMARHFWDQLSWDKLYILSAYRSKTYQDGLFVACRADACAKWWASEHQAGLAIDLRVMTKWGKLLSLDHPNKYTDRLHAHAHEWGFHNTYQKGIAIDGKIVEWWHWRYMWEELATLLWEKGMTIAEYYNGLNK